MEKTTHNAFESVINNWLKSNFPRGEVRIRRDQSTGMFTVRFIGEAEPLSQPKILADGRENVSLFLSETEPFVESRCTDLLQAVKICRKFSD